MRHGARRMSGPALMTTALAVMALLLPALGCGSEDGADSVTGSPAPTYEQTVPLFPVTAAGGRMGYIDNTGKLAIAAQFAEAAPFSEGLAAVRREPNGLWGYIDVAGSAVIETQFAEAAPFSEGLAAVRLDVNGSWGYVDTSGALVIPPQFGAAYGFSQGLGRVRADQESGYVDKAGEWVIRMTDQEAVGEFSGGLALVFDRTADRYGYIDQEGELAVEPIYVDAWGFSADMAAVRLADDSGYGYIDRHGEWVIEPQFEDARPFSEGVAAVRWTTTGYWGYVDVTGTELLPAQWDLADPFDEGIARVGFVVGDTDNDGSLTWGYAYIGLDGRVIWRDENYAAFLAGTITTVPVTDPPRPAGSTPATTSP